ncbi:MAG TPA: hypothetical protein VFD48_07390 [Pyrinomonadaceae bacterium]|nr:hypothetical protein [Pyrinomonadaceae bacterium]
MASREARASSFGRLSKVLMFLTLLTAATLAWMSPVKAGRVESVVQEPDEVVLTLKPEGFIPAEVTRVPGRFQLSVDNRSEVEQLTLHFKGADGTLLREIRILRGGSDWSELFDLAPGDYTLFEANHANWVCAFTIRNL